MAEANQGQPDEELTVPRAALNKMIKELLPHTRVANDARELILNCCTEFIHLIASEANEICNRQTKKTISPEHVLTALERLGYASYLDDCRSVLKECKTEANRRRLKSHRLENLGIPEEELLRQQQALFEEARRQQAMADQQEWLEMQAAAAAATNQQTDQQELGQLISPPPIPGQHPPEM